MTCADGAGSADGRGEHRRSTRKSSGVPASPSGPSHDHLGEAFVTADELAVGICREQWQVVDVRVGQIDAEQVPRLRLDVGPGREAPRACHQAAVRSRPAVPSVVERILAQEHLMRRMRGVGLVLVNEGGCLVHVLVEVVRRAEDAVRTGLVGGPCQHHEVVVRTAGNIKWIVGLQRDEHRPALSLVDEIQAVVEELAEERKPLIERRAAIGLHVGDDTIAIRIRRCCRWIGSRVHIHDQIADRARLRVHHHPVGLQVRGRNRGCRPGAIRIKRFRVAEHRVGYPREQAICGAEIDLARHGVVVGSVNRAKTKRKIGTFQRRVRLCSDDLRENEIEIGSYEFHGILPYPRPLEGFTRN